MASIFERIRNKNKNEQTALQARNSELANAGDVTKLSDYDVHRIINSIRSTNDDYKSKYLEYDYMAEDDIIGSALELYADDATQIDTDTSKRITIISNKNESLRKDIEAFLQSLDVEDKLWNWAYQVAKYGDMYTRVVFDKNGNIVYLEDIDDPCEMLDLHYKGVRVNYAREIPQEERTSRSSSNRVEYEFYSPNSFIHFMTRNSSRSDEFYVEVKDSSSEGSEVRKYKVIRGCSMIEKARTSFRIIRLLEDSLLAARVAKAEYVRVYNVEVGENTSPTESRKAIRRVKSLFDATPSIDIREGKYVANKKLRPVGDPIFNPVRGGKGSISTETVGGDFEVKSLVDVDYFNDKLFSALKVPKAMLGFDEQLPGGLGDNTLMMQDLRYARSVKKISQALISGLTQLVNLWLISNNREKDINEFTITLTSPSSSEEIMRLKELELRIETSEKLLSLSRDFQDYLDLPELAGEVLRVIANYPELQETMSKSYAKASDRWKKANESDNEDDSDNLDDMDEEEM